MVPRPTFVAHHSTPLRQGLATLPGLLDDAAPVNCIPGGSGWATRARKMDADDTLLVVDVPTPTDDPLDLRATVLLHRTWTDAPELALAAAEAAPLVEETALALALVVCPVGTDVRHALTEQLDLVERLLGETALLRVVRQDRTGHDALATLVSGCRVSMTVVCTDAKPPSATVELVRPDQAIRYRLTDPTSAAPNEIILESAGVMRRLPLVWEPAARGLWRRVRATLDGGQHPDDLARFQRQQRIVAAALG